MGTGTAVSYSSGAAVASQVPAVRKLGAASPVSTGKRLGLNVPMPPSTPSVCGRCPTCGMAVTY